MEPARFGGGGGEAEMITMKFCTYLTNRQIKLHLKGEIPGIFCTLQQHHDCAKKRHCGNWCLTDDDKHYAACRKITIEITETKSPAAAESNAKTGGGEKA